MITFLIALFAFFVFCLASSAIYVINDIVDIEADRAHPVKKNRPLPSGQISVTSSNNYCITFTCFSFLADDVFSIINLFY